MGLLGALIGLCGCNGEKDTGVSPSGDTGGDDTATSPVDADDGSVVVLAWAPSWDNPAPSTVVLGLFAADRLGVLNLAQCVGSAESFCTSELPPSPGSSVLVTALDPDLKDDLQTRKVGAEITLGEWVGSYQFDSSTDIGFYYATSSDISMPTGPLGLHLGGDWGPYDGTDDVRAPTALRVTDPDPTDAQEFYDTVPIHLEWDPGTEGDLYLYVETPAEQRLYRLDDTGAYDLDLSALGLGNGAAVDLILGRWGRGTVDHQGNQVEILVQSNQRIHGTWRTLGERTEIVDTYDECSLAQTAPSAVPGNYFGDLAGSTDDLNPLPAGCTGFKAAGIDRVVPIDLQPDDQLTVNYQLVSDDASLYLLTDCSDETTCLAGVDQANAGDVEQIVWFNDTGAPLRVYAVLDAFEAVTDIFNLDIIVESLSTDILVPTCVDAIAQGPAAAGSYHGSVALHADLLQPYCAAPANGGEGMTEVLLGPGEQLRATVEAPGGNPKLYLLSNCAIGDSCFLANDQGAGATEEIVYTNPSPASQYLYLVLDSDSSLNEYFLDLEIQ
ncbi:MAG: hypothetical protein ABMA64_12630 [Myxococcota bacterium]